MNRSAFNGIAFALLWGLYLMTVVAEVPPASPPWAGAVLSERAAQDRPAAPWLEVVQQSYLRQPGVGKSVMQTPLQIRDKRYEQGLGTYATSVIRVRLPKAGRSFQAEVGIDNNFQTKGKLGTAIFVVEARGQEVFRSDVRRASDPPLPVKVDLKGAEEFILRVLDAGDGPEYDEVDWADASVRLEDEGRLWLDQFAIVLAPAKFSPGIPFSFVYAGKSSSDLLSGWKQTYRTSSPSPGKQQHFVTFTDPGTGLEIVSETTVFDRLPAVDWVVYFRNTGASNSPILENIRAMDLQVNAPSEGEIMLHHSHGSTATATDFLPIDEALAPNAQIHLAPVDGRSSDTTLPFFNLEWGRGGVIGAIGWSGQWSMRVSRDGGSGLSLQAGQQLTHLRLRPGETIRTPRLLLMAWRGGEAIGGHNQFRRLLVAHYLPRINGEVVMPPVTQNTWFTHGANGITEANQLQIIGSAAQLGVECYWLDAGWFEGGWPDGAGSWSPRPEAFPNGLKPLGDAAHKQGMKFVLWFEPERVCPASRIAREHPEWVMHVRPGEEVTPIQNLRTNALFKLGDPEARQWMTGLLSRGIADWGVDIYRQDFNIFGALRFWQAADAPDRQGMAENLHIQGLYAMWDELLRRHPGLVIDNCASGGRRMDLELLSRSLPLWRSDSQCVGKPMPVQDQVQTAGLSLYVPLQAAAVWSCDPYEWRSVATAGANLCMDTQAPGFDKPAAQRAIKEIKELRPLWLGDYYPLTRLSPDESQWCAWQFHRPDLGRGFALYFRRPKSNYLALESGLRGLHPGTVYEVTFADSGTNRTMTGKELAAMPVRIRQAPGSALICYRVIAK